MHDNWNFAFLAPGAHSIDSIIQCVRNALADQQALRHADGHCKKIQGVNKDVK